MKKNKKLLVLVALFLAVFAVGGTLAYLTDTSKEVTNTFTFGKVEITLKEPHWNANGDAADMAPGMTVTKDPTVTVTSESKDAYVFVKVTIPTGTAGDSANQELFEVVEPLGAGWVDVTDDINDLEAGEHVYAYGTTSVMKSVTKGTELPAVFSEITANPNLTATDLSNINNTANVVVHAYAIQAEGLGGHVAPADVWGDLGV